MCKSTETQGHTFIDAVVFKEYAATGGEYTAMNGNRYQWQRCTGCGNVTQRLVRVIDQRSRI